MRVACVYIPSFPLQAAIVGSVGASASGSIAIVTQPAVGSPVVVACSRAAWLAGVRPGTTATVARTVDPELQCVIADVAAERALLRAVADGLLGIAPRVELGGEPRGQHHVMYAEVPAGRRGTWFGAKVREMLALFGLRGRIGIADDRFTAFVAASAAARDEEDAVVCVPRGGSAAYLAPQPLSLLQLGPEVLHMLEALGVKTLGQFAELPPPSVMRPDRGGWDADFQALARGDGGTELTAYAPSGPIAERVELASTMGVAVQQLSQRLAARLAGRNPDGGAVELMVRLTGGSALPAIRSVVVPESDAQSLADAIGRALGGDAYTTIETIARPESASLATLILPTPAAEPVRHEAEPIAPLVLLPTPAAYARGAERVERVEHRRTRRGKQRPRIGTGQARLFAGD
jgi:protein ImuB